jgi:hypothetical protein
LAENHLARFVVDILVIAKTMGTLKLGTISLDGTKIKASVSKHKALSWKYANQLESQLKKEVEELMRLAEQSDNSDPVESMKYRLRIPEGRALYGKRKSTIESTFGIVKHVLGFSLYWVQHEKYVRIKRLNTKKRTPRYQPIVKARL